VEVAEADEDETEEDVAVVEEIVPGLQRESQRRHPFSREAPRR